MPDSEQRSEIQVVYTTDGRGVCPECGNEIRKVER